MSLGKVLLVMFSQVFYELSNKNYDKLTLLKYLSNVQS